VLNDGGRGQTLTETRWWPAATAPQQARVRLLVVAMAPHNIEGKTRLQLLSWPWRPPCPSNSSSDAALGRWKGKQGRRGGGGKGEEGEQYSTSSGTVGTCLPDTCARGGRRLL
jgi:hypothetical protein